MLLDAFLRPLIRKGQLTVIDAHGQERVYGPPDPNGDTPRVTLRLHDARLHHRLFLSAPVAFGEAYMDGMLTVEPGDIADLLALLMSNVETAPPSLLQGLIRRWRFLLRRLHQYNPAARAKRNVAHHYDLSEHLYRLFLDSDLQYSCAYFEYPGESIEGAQEAKKRHVAAKLDLKPDNRVLDIGSGWGGLGLYLNAEAGADVTGVTLSEEQLKVASARARDAGVTDHVRFLLEDYRHLEGSFDRIVSVGMFEHVGVGHYRAFFNKLARLLANDGVAVLHTIGRSDGPGTTAPWIKKYIFPGGYTPALSEMLPAIERAGLIVTDVEVLRLHYAETLKAWRERFYRHWDEVAALYDERFCRMWEFYLAGAEMGFRHGRLMVFQLQLAHRPDAVPLTRDYLYRKPSPAAMDLRSSYAQGG